VQQDDRAGGQVRRDADDRPLVTVVVHVVALLFFGLNAQVQMLPGTSSRAAFLLAKVLMTRQPVVADGRPAEVSSI